MKKSVQLIKKDYDLFHRTVNEFAAQVQAQEDRMTKNNCNNGAASPVVDRPNPRRKVHGNGVGKKEAN